MFLLDAQAHVSVAKAHSVPLYVPPFLQRAEEIEFLPGRMRLILPNGVMPNDRGCYRFALGLASVIARNPSDDLLKQSASCVSGITLIISI